MDWQEGVAAYGGARYAAKTRHTHTRAAYLTGVRYVRALT